MSTDKKQFTGLKAVFLNCSLKGSQKESHTQVLMNRLIHIMETEGVAVKNVHMNEHEVAARMTKDAREDGLNDEWPEIQNAILEADIFVMGTPIWLGVKSSLATLAIERMYAYSGDSNEKGQYPYYGKVGGCVITGNEDGVKHCARDILYSLQHIGYTIPPQADCGWLGEVGPGPSYGDTEWKGEELSAPVGFDSEFTNRNTTFTAWNLMHIAQMLKANEGVPAKGNTSKDWKQVTNATDLKPEPR